MQIDGLERHLATRVPLHVVEGEHHHARDPEEDDVVAGLHDLRGVEARQVRRVFVWPAQRRVRPQPRREPRVQRVLILTQGGAAARLARLGVVDGNGQTPAGVAVPDGNAVAPPELPADAPVPDVLHPVLVGALEALGNETDAPVAHRVEGGARQRLDAHEPLLRDDRLDDGAGALAVAHGVRIRLDALDEPARLEVGDDAVTRLEALEPRVRARLLVEVAVRGQNREHRQSVPFTDLEVDRVMARRHLQRTRARFQRDRLIAEPTIGTTRPPAGTIALRPISCA